MALVITLIMLSVTLIMAIAFLAISRRERVSVGSSTDTTVARFATDTGLAAAQSQILANILTTPTALYNYNLLVSTNYINGNGFNPALLPGPNNVSYYYANGSLLVGADFAQNVANLQILPRAPVMVSGTEPAGRFYLDLNRNGAFEDSGWVTNVDIFGNGIFDANGSSMFYEPAGDPQWVGVLERPGLPHGPDNKFTSRYAFIALPVGDSLDINAGHNQAVLRTVNLNNGLLPVGIGDSYMRNQGVGSWELNFAAFLADLNTNQWLPTAAPNNNFYAYYEPLGSINRGAAFDDARALLSYRYNFNYLSLSPASQLFGALNFGSLRFDNIDEYSDGPLQLTTTNIVEIGPAIIDKVTQPWAGADNPNKFYTPSDFFQTNRTLTTTLANRLVNAGTNTYNNANNVVPTYDRYTFYRMLDQLGTDSLPDYAGKLNLNYSNAVVSYDNFGAYVSTAIIPGAETNLVAWSARDFFCAAADRLLRLYTTNWFQADPTNYLTTYYGLQNVQYTYTNSNNNIITNDPSGLGLVSYLGVPNVLGMTSDGVPAFGLTNIPVMVNGNFVYSPAVNRVLQLALNIYDASTNRAAALGKDYPSVFRPIFYRNAVNGNIFITGFEQIFSSAQSDNPLTQSPIYAPYLPNGESINNVYGVPWFIGAKKGFPSFNQFVMRNDFQLTRKLEVTRTKLEAYSSVTSHDFHTNQMFLMSITNHIGFSFWNSYQGNYAALNALTVVVRDSANMVLSNGFNNGMSVSAGWPNPTQVIFPSTFTFNANTWPGSAWNVTQDPGTRSAAMNSFAFGTFHYAFLPQSVYVAGNSTFIPASLNPPYEVSTAVNPFPQFVLMSTNGFQAYILDGTQIIDYVQLSGPTSVRNLNAEIQDVYSGLNNAPYHMWYTNNNLGYLNQITVSQKGPGVAPANSWVAPSGLPPAAASPPGEAAFFAGFFAPSWNYGGKSYVNTNLTIQAPYTPARNAYSYTVWQANDPLVHYLSSDLNDVNDTTGLHISDDPAIQPPPSITLTLTNVAERYQPWGRAQQMAGLGSPQYDTNRYNLAYRDPLVYGSDNWDFPTNKYPTVGWLGRVHRGTPWQTVYLKSTNLLELNVPGNPSANSTGQNTWNYWTGDFKNFDSLNSRPIQDDLLFDVFTAVPNENATLGTLSVNQMHLAAWSAVLGGMNIIANATPGIPNFSTPPLQTNIIINPVGPSGIGVFTPLGQIINDINNTRTNAIMFPLQAYKRAGDLLRVPSLSVQSPFLNRSDAYHVTYDISDEMYESIPQQIMGLVRPSGPPRFVVYTWGQTLKPAPDGTVLSSTLLPSGYNPFGLVTNYQVTAESATRAVITVIPVITNTPTGPLTNYNLKVDSYNVLPPD